MDNKKSGAKTLLLSVIMSSPGPLVVGLVLLQGHSSTQIADFIRRTAEFLAIIMSFVVYMLTTNKEKVSLDKKRKMEDASNIFVGTMMCLGGLLMTYLTITNDNADKGNFIPSLVIALLSAFANSIFWGKYTKLDKKNPNAILKVQARLYRAKTLIDSCVSIALLSLLIAPETLLSFYLDFIGSVIVAIYLLWCGVKTIFETLKKKNQ